MSAVTVGRTVHYHSYHAAPGAAPSTPKAAIVTGVAQDGERVHLVVLEKSGMVFKHHISYSEEPAAGCWSWPPRV